ncbi:low molecular weight phosphotyrosine protein phosphatase [Erythrobacter litoralis]|uniref:low molecular weight protein-tyrosine-phosphatase n=1 Tax=Erythrobacter litoralis TaxID=39960 RepID=UPI002435AFDF|nr:low molecular weight phosphotyrosine protein phosphatase [Erythrobacter litoralis]MDG6079713.1 low molecular weight phosphotyrosine protein phosphatase [Erythrobacter litoralis]
MSKPAVLFVCLGNICRSPLAEAAFRRATDEAGLDVETASAGTADYHVGAPPDPRSIAEADARGIHIAGYRGRQLKPSDFGEFDYILAMDASNLADIRRLDPGDGKAKTALLLDLVPGQHGREVADPYYGGDDGFAVTFDEVEAGARALVAVLLDEHG